MIWTFLYILGGTILSAIILLNIHEFYKIYNEVQKYPMSLKDIKNLLVYGNSTKFEERQVKFGDTNAGLYIAAIKGEKYREDNKSTAVIYTDNIPHYFYMTDVHREILISIANRQIGDKLKEKIQQKSLEKAIDESRVASKSLEKDNGGAVSKFNLEKN